LVFYLTCEFSGFLRVSLVWVLIFSACIGVPLKGVLKRIHRRLIGFSAVTRHSDVASAQHSQRKMCE
jgi:hypothetical protein